MSDGLTRDGLAEPRRWPRSWPRTAGCGVRSSASSRAIRPPSRQRILRRAVPRRRRGAAARPPRHRDRPRSPSSRPSSASSDRTSSSSPSASSTAVPARSRRWTRKGRSSATRSRRSAGASRSRPGSSPRPHLLTARHRHERGHSRSWWSVHQRRLRSYRSLPQAIPQLDRVQHPRPRCADGYFDGIVHGEQQVRPTAAVKSVGVGDEP